MATYNWYEDLYDKVNEWAQEWKLTEDQQHELTNFIVQQCRENFKAGNRSGADWATDQARQKIARGETI